MSKDKGYTVTFTVNLNDEEAIKKREEIYNKIVGDLEKYGSYILVNDKGEILKFDDERD